MEKKSGARTRSSRHAAAENGTPRVSLADVARYAKVSTATVSRVLNTPESVSEVKRHAVTSACETLGYVVNGAARTLSSNRSYTIGAVVPTLETQTFSRTLAAFQKRVHDAGYTLLLASSGFDPTVELDEVTTLLGHGVDALAVVGHTHDPKMWERIDRQGIPCVQLLTLDVAHPSIGFDNAAVGYLLADHLVQLGHRDLGVIVGTPPSNDRVADRNLGVNERLRGVGAALAPGHVIDDAFSLVEAREAALKMLGGNRQDRPTAMVCGNDQLAFGVLLAAASLGLRVPEDLSVIGFNNYDFAAHLTPALTTVSVDLVQLGRQSAEYLLQCLTGAAPRLPAAIIETALIVRESTGPAPAPAVASARRSRKAHPA